MGAQIDDNKAMGSTLPHFLIENPWLRKCCHVSGRYYKSRKESKKNGCSFSYAKSRYFLLHPIEEFVEAPLEPSQPEPVLFLTQRFELLFIEQCDRSVAGDWVTVRYNKHCCRRL